jgi:hypothetical protein
MDDASGLYLRPTWVGPSHFSVCHTEPPSPPAAHAGRDGDEMVAPAGDEAE